MFQEIKRYYRRYNNKTIDLIRYAREEFKFLSLPKSKDE